MQVLPLQMEAIPSGRLNRSSIIDLAPHRKSKVINDPTKLAGLCLGSAPVLPLAASEASYSNLALQRWPLTFRFTVKNTSGTNLKESVQLYARLPLGPRFGEERMIGWEQINLEPDEKVNVAVGVDERLVSTLNTKTGGWDICTHVWLEIKNLGQIKHAGKVYSSTNEVCQFRK